MIQPMSIRLILAESIEAVQVIAKALDVNEVYHIGNLMEQCGSSPDTVYYEIGTSLDQMLAFASCFNVSTGVACVSGRKQFIGYNRDWMTKLLVNDMATAIARAVPEELLSAMTEEDKDDPYEALGYARR